MQLFLERCRGTPHPNRDINRNQKFYNGHGKPYRFCAKQHRKGQNQKAADDQSSCDGNDKRDHRLQKGLKIIG